MTAYMVVKVYKNDYFFFSNLFFCYILYISTSEQVPSEVGMQRSSLS